MTDKIEDILGKLTTIVEHLAKDVETLKNPPVASVVEEVNELPAPKRALEIKPEHPFVVVNESDYADDLTESGRTLISTRDSFATLEEAREYAHLATERPLYIGEVGRSEDESGYKVRLKLRYASSI